MELRPGYKQTEAGVMPEDWQVKTLSEVGSFKKGRNIPKNRLSTSGHPCVLYGEIYTTYDYVVKELVSRIPDEIAKQSTSIQYGDILFAGSGETAPGYPAQRFCPREAYRYNQQPERHSEGHD